MNPLQSEAVKWLARLIGVAFLCGAAYLRGEDAAMLDEQTQREIMDLAQQIAAGVIGAAWLLAGQLIHRAQTGGFFKPSGGDAGAKA